jgi:hypothetical protein
MGFIKNMISYYTPLLGPVHGREPSQASFLAVLFAVSLGRLWLYFELDF